MVPTDENSMISANRHSMISVEDETFQSNTLLAPTRLLEQILDTLEALVVVLDRQGRIVLFNRASEQVTGRAVEEVFAESFVETLIVPEERAEVQMVLDRLLAETVACDSEAAVRGMEHTWEGEHGEPHLIRWSATRVDGQADCAFGVVVTGIDVTQKRTLEREVVNAEEEVRRQFGAELHDMLASHLAGTAMMASALTRKVERGGTADADDLRRLTELVRDAMEQVRALSHSFIAPELEADDLVEALKRLAERTEAASGVACSCTVCEEVQPVAPTGERATHLYRIAQEAFHNAVTHANPTHIELSMACRETASGGEALVLEVRDDGHGVPESESEGVGLRNMQRRAERMNASLSVEALDEGGTCVQCTVPLSST